MYQKIRIEFFNAVTCCICIIVISFSIASCCNEDKKTKDEVETVWNIANEHPDGFTLNLSNMSFPKRGIVVAYSETQNSFGKDCLPKVISCARRHANIVGGWYDAESGKYYFDADTIFSEDDTIAAKAFGISQKQIAIYILSKDSSIYLSNV